MSDETLNVNGAPLPQGPLPNVNLSDTLPAAPANAANVHWLGDTTTGNISASYPAATATQLGGVKQGANISIAADGTLSSVVPDPIVLAVPQPSGGQIQFGPAGAPYGSIVAGLSSINRIVGITSGAYLDASTIWHATDTNMAFLQIGGGANAFVVNFATGQTIGTTPTFTTGFVMDWNGNLIMPNALTAGTLTVSGNATAASLTVTGSATVTGQLVTGSTMAPAFTADTANYLYYAQSHSGGESCHFYLPDSGNIQIRNSTTLEFTGAVRVDGALTVAGNLLADGALTVVGNFQCGNFIDTTNGAYGHRALNGGTMFVYTTDNAALCQWHMDKTTNPGQVYPRFSLQGGTGADGTLSSICYFSCSLATNQILYGLGNELLVANGLGGTNIILYPNDAGRPNSMASITSTNVQGMFVAGGNNGVSFGTGTTTLPNNSWQIYDAGGGHLWINWRDGAGTTHQAQLI